MCRPLSPSARRPAVDVAAVVVSAVAVVVTAAVAAVAAAAGSYSFLAAHSTDQRWHRRCCGC